MSVVGVAAVIATVVIALVGANALHDRGAPRSFLRAFAAMLGGVAFLLVVLLLEARVATVLAWAVTAGIIGLRVRFAGVLRGVRGIAPTQAWAEVTFPLAGALSLSVGWLALGDRWLAFAPIAFMAWGDAATGIVRLEGARLLGRDAPSFVMGLVCLAVAATFQPGWIGVSGALIATLAEGRTPQIASVRDDNLVIVGSSLAVMALARAAVG